MQYVGLFLFRKDREKLIAAFQKTSEGGKDGEEKTNKITAQDGQRPVSTIAGYFASLVRKK